MSRVVFTPGSDGTLLTVLTGCKRGDFHDSYEKLMILNDYLHESSNKDSTFENSIQNFFQTCIKLVT